MAILLPGGAGFIGSHTAVELLNKGREIVIIDNFSNSTPKALEAIKKITGKESMFKSPTDMGVNRVGFGIVDDEVVKEASRQEIIRRYFKTGCEYKKGYVDKETFEHAKLIMEQVNLKPEDRKVVIPARERAAKLKEENNNICTAVAIELNDGSILTGKGSELLDASAAALLNSVKHLANIADDINVSALNGTEPYNRVESS